MTPKDAATIEKVLDIRKWTDALWSLRITRPRDYLFQPGHYARLGLGAADGETDDRLWRPYSIVSAPDDDALEFLFILIPGGPLSERLRTLGAGDAIWLDRRAFGFFLPGQLAAGDVLWMLATGTGLGPYISMLRAGEVQCRFSRLVLVHSCRFSSEQAYEDELTARADSSGGSFTYLPLVTREPAANGTPSGRIPALLESGRLQAQAGAALDPETARVMVCGNPGFTADMRQLLAAKGFIPCRRNTAGSMLFENYW